MSERYQMASPQWLAALHAFMVAARPQLSFPRDFTFCEVYTNVPSPVPSVGGTVAWSARFFRDTNEVEFQLGVPEAADLRLTFDYGHVLPIARFGVDGDPRRQAEMDRMLAAAVESGHATMEGALPEFLAGSPVHDQMVRVTA